MNEELADTLRKLRFQHGDLSQDEVAKRIGVSLSTYSRFERSEAEIDLNTAIAVADLYKITVDQLLHMHDPEFTVQETKSVYQKRWTVPITVGLDGTPDTLEMWVKKLTAINEAL